MNEFDLERLLDISISLSSEKDRDRLLERILDAAMDIAHCDAGTLYILSDQALQFRYMVTKSRGIRKGGRHGAIDLPPVPLGPDNACAHAALSRELINVADSYLDDRFDFSGPQRYDALTGYRTRSILVVPMEDDTGAVIGVLQLINALDDSGASIPFCPQLEPVIRALGSQAAICLTNMNYAAAIVEMMDSFIRGMSTAIDARSPYNANHTRNMVGYGERFLAWAAQDHPEWVMEPLQQREFLLSVWLHDVGKLTTPLEVMNKSTRLGMLTKPVEMRLRLISLLDRSELTTGVIDQVEYEFRRARMASVKALIEQVNGGRPLDGELTQQVAQLAQLTYRDEDGDTAPWFTPEELECLSIPRGTLTARERGLMEEHVVMTARILEQMKFPPEYARVLPWAGGHHEFINGSGYPSHLAGDQVPKQIRLLTILDVFEALTAVDRPYSPPRSPQVALDILDSMAAEGKVDSEILALFRESRAWEVPV